MSRRGFGPKPDRLQQRVPRLSEINFRGQQETQVEIRVEIIGLKPDRRPVAGFGLRRASLSPIAFPEVALRLRVRGIDRNRLRNKLDRACRVTLLVGDHAKQMQGVEVRRVGAENPGIELFRLPQATGLMLCDGHSEYLG